MTNLNEKSPREIIDAYSPITRGKKGLFGGLLKAIAKPVEMTRNALGAMSRFPIGFGYENAAGQILTGCDAVIPDTFARMEKKLRASFNVAARCEASPIERETFLQLAQDVRADAEVLQKHCTVLRTEFDSVTERYNFVLAKEPVNDRDFKILTLEQGVAAVKKQMADVPEPAETKVPVLIRRKPVEFQDSPLPRM